MMVKLYDARRLLALAKAKESRERMQRLLARKDEQK